MKLEYHQTHWVATGRGLKKPVVVEAESFSEALRAFWELVEAQQDD